MTELILHIGCEKTGTTTLQKFLQANGEAFRAFGVCYPSSLGLGNHLKLPVAAISDDNWNMYIRVLLGVISADHLRSFRAEVQRELKKETDGFEKVVISSEHFAAAVLLREDIEWLKCFLSDLYCSIRVIVYLRRQDLFHASLYSTQVRLGATHRLSYPADEMIARKYDYRRLLRRWAEFFPNIEVRRFDGRELKNGNIVDDFIDATGLPFPNPVNRSEIANEALGAHQLEFLRNVNRYLPLRIDGRISRKRGNIDRVIDLIPKTGGRIQMREGLARKLMVAMYDSNRWVAEEFCGGCFEEGDPLFGELNFSTDVPYELLGFDQARDNANALMQAVGAPNAACNIFDGANTVESVYETFAAWWARRSEGC